MDKDDNIYVVHGAGLSSNKMGAWEYQDVFYELFGFLYIETDEDSLAIDNAGNLHLVFIASKEFTRHLFYATNLGGSWQLAEIDNRDYWEYDPAIALDSKGNVHLISVLEQDHKVRYVTFDPEELDFVQTGYTLTIDVAGQGTTSPLPGSHDYPEGTEVSITANSAEHWEFSHWSGDLTGTQNPAQITMDSDKSVTAIFTEEAPPPACKVFGLGFGPYVYPGQNPDWGTVIPESQIRELIAEIAPYTSWVRTWGSTHGLEYVGETAHEYGLKAAIGAWLSDDLDANEEQITSLIGIGQAGEADLLIVGSEVLLRHDLTEAQLIDYINQVKTAVPGVPVSTADTYAELLYHPAVMETCDWVLPNYYPYWEGKNINEALYFINLWHMQVVAAAGGKPVVVSETGWPSAGPTLGEAKPSPENASFFFLNFISWAKAKDVDYYYFEAFDEPWKGEGGAGAHWGIWTSDGVMKPDMERVFNCETIPDNWSGSEIPPCEPGESQISFIYVPLYGSYDDLEGRVCGIDSAEDYRVAVYIYVSGWWTKPFWNNPLTIIKSDGTWTCDITTGGIDSQATQIAAFLVPFGYQPPSLSGRATLPAELDDNSVAKCLVTRTPD
jgi:exo-beta-1,3-glucanase (GH17 family)